jgi:hypothetical protein
VADSRRAGKLRNHVGRENLLHVAKAFVHVNIRAIGGSDAGGFLSAMLERVEAEIVQLRSFGMAEYPEDTAMIVEVIVVDLY